METHCATGSPFTVPNVGDNLVDQSPLPSAPVQDAPAIDASVPPESSTASPSLPAESAPGDSVDDWDAPLAAYQQKEVTSKLLDPIQITFKRSAERIRAQKPLLPAKFYRTFYETSATLSSFVSIDTHVKHRKRPDLKIDKSNAFQAVAEFKIHQFLTKEAIERHLVWNQKKKPSAFISAFNKFSHARRRAEFHYANSQRIGQRVSVAQISTSGLIPATVQAKCESIVNIFNKHKCTPEILKSKTFVQDVKIPVWIRQTSKEGFGSSMTAEELATSGADIWLSITEIRKSNLKELGPKSMTNRDIICAKGHDYEWLCCGNIPLSFITNVMPWDGKTLFHKNPGSPIRSFENSGQPWVFNWEKKMWLPELLERTVTTSRDHGTRKKRKIINDREYRDSHASAQSCSVHAQVLTFSTITIYIDRPPQSPSK